MFDKIALRNGTLNFSALSAGTGPIVFLLHGFPDTPLTFSKQMEALARAGYQAIAVTMRGYETSSQPADGDYHAIRMAEDVVAWAADIGSNPVHLVGHDWGASIAYAAASYAPECFSSLTTLAVPHPVRFGEAYAATPDQQRRSAYILEFLAPRFEDTITAANFQYLEKLWHAWSPGWIIPQNLIGAVKVAFQNPGVAKAALEYYRQGFDSVSLAGQQSGALFAKPITIPTLGICGQDDECIPPAIFKGAMRTQDFPSELRIECIEGAGHFLHCERPEEVNQLIVEWIGTHQS